MEVGDLYQFILLVVLVGMILGVGLITLSEFESSANIGGEASEALNASVDALVPIATTWLPLIVTIAVLAIILGLVINSFGGFRKR